MAPSFLSIHEKHKNNMNINGSYASDLSDLILDTKPSLWFHGHMHTSFDYMVGDTRILCNPRGYIGHEINQNFDHQSAIFHLQTVGEEIND
jgi:Icc-related predicted phosphoesterase